MTSIPAPATAPASALAALDAYGQSVWLDYIRRSAIASGEVARLVESGVKGVTSNPAIFEKAIAGSNDYDADIERLSSDGGLTAKDLYERMAIADIQAAADVLRGVYDTSGRDGFVSLEVSPELANDSVGTLEEARRLWGAIARPNAMIKVPATAAGIVAIRQLIAEGINVNVTLLFAKSVYETVANAYLEGLELRARDGHDPSRVASVASFFVSRIDSAVETRVQKMLPSASDETKARLESLLGKVAIANAKLAYQSFKTIFAGPRWDALAAKGAQRQRVLWASTGTKNPAYSDVLYVEELVGPHTVNTMPLETLTAFRHHGRVRPSLEEDVEGAVAVLERLEASGIPLQQITDELLADGLVKFVQPFERLLAAIERRCREANAPRRNAQLPRLAANLAHNVEQVLDQWDREGGTRRIYEGDASLWTGADEANWLGWLGITRAQLDQIDTLSALRDHIRRSDFTHAVLLGMGGSSLCPEVWKRTFGVTDGYPELLVLDSTDPVQIRHIEAQIDIDRTLFIVSSKSGSTLEPDIFRAHFFERVSNRVGRAAAGMHFVAVTDPGSQLDSEARLDRFRYVFPGVKEIGGRYSAMSNFGMVPAAIMGLDVERLLDEAERMQQACAPGVAAAQNPGLVLGTILGAAARAGRDKLTIIASPGIQRFGAWLEQLIAESTGKDGRGIVPVDGEDVGPPDVYGADRLFAYLRLDDAPDETQDRAVALLEQQNHPVVRIQVATRYDLAEEFMRWEIATAVAGTILGIHPFNQPDVEASKIATRTLTAAYERTGALPAADPFFTDADFRFFADDANREIVEGGAGSTQSAASYLRAHLNRLKEGDYFAMLAYIPMFEAHEEVLGTIRRRVRDAKRVATCVGFGPRFLHSTGQLYKGGPNTGVFLQLTCDDAEDLPVPGRSYTFGIVKAAQALGDLEVLNKRQRRVLHVHLGADPGAGLAALDLAIADALR